jgi:hypothetical protein
MEPSVIGDGRLPPALREGAGVKRVAVRELTCGGVALPPAREGSGAPGASARGRRRREAPGQARK